MPAVEQGSNHTYESLQAADLQLIETAHQILRAGAKSPATCSCSRSSPDTGVGTNANLEPCWIALGSASRVPRRSRLRAARARHNWEWWTTIPPQPGAPVTARPPIGP